SLGQALMTPTRIYVKPLLQLIKDTQVHALAHITGGGLLDNIPRVLPNNCKAVIDTRSWEMPLVFQWLQHNGKVAAKEMYRTFNCGVGMVIAVPAAEQERALALLQQAGEQAFAMGKIASAPPDEPRVELLGF